MEELDRKLSRYDKVDMPWTLTPLLTLEKELAVAS